LWGNIGSFQDQHCQPKRSNGVLVIWQPSQQLVQGISNGLVFC
jgi:hypothetical protein